LKASFAKMIEASIDSMLALFCNESNYPENWDWEGIIGYTLNIFFDNDEFQVSSDERRELEKDDLKQKILDRILEKYEQRENEIGSERMREFERVVLLRVVDEKWMDHIDAMDQLRYGIGLRAYGQRDPVVEYKFEGYEMFEEMRKNIQEDAVKILLKARINKEQPIERRKVAEPVDATHGEGPKKPVVRMRKVGRNDLCPCGSGKKYKNCCGRNERASG